MVAIVNFVSDPISKKLSKSVELDRPITIRHFLNEQEIEEFSLPTICIFNGAPLMRAQWSGTIINNNDIVAFVSLPQDPGDGTSKQITAIVLSLAVAVAAPYLGGVIGGALGGFFAGTIGKALITAAIGAAGSALISAVIPQQKQNGGAGLSLGGNPTSPSPTYTIQAQGNQARFGSPIPTIYGKHKIFPDFGTVPYTQFIQNTVVRPFDQFLYQVHIIGQGEYDISDLKLGDTPLDNFEDIDYEIVGPDADITLFDTNVYTVGEVAGQTLEPPDGGGDWVGPFVCSPAGTTTNKIEIDIVLPRGVHYFASNGDYNNWKLDWTFEYREIDDNGDPVGAGTWTTLGTESTGTTSETTIVRMTFAYVVSSGRYEVRGKRTNNKYSGSSAGDEIQWSAMKAYLEQTNDFSGLTKIAFKMKATNQLTQQSSRTINCIAYRKLNTYDPETGWSASKVATRSIAWALADIAKAQYGGNLADSRIDLDKLAELDATWTTRGDVFDAIFDSGITVWEGLTKTAKCGRTVPFMQWGTLRFHRDEAVSIPTAMFTMRNIRRNSLNIDYILPSDDTADSLEIEYFDKRYWSPRKRDVALPDSNEEKPFTMQFFGLVEYAQVDREGLYLAASNRYRRRIITFETELEGMIPTFGNLIAISHDLPEWGTSGELTSYDSGTGIIGLSEPVTFDAGNHYLSLRKRDGSVSGPWLVTAGADAYTVVLDNPPLDFTPDIDDDRERTHFAFGQGDNWAAEARVLAIRPRNGGVEISCINEHDTVHTADGT